MAFSVRARRLGIIAPDESLKYDPALIRRQHRKTNTTDFFITHARLPIAVNMVAHVGNFHTTAGGCRVKAAA